MGLMTVCKHCGYNASPEAIYCIMCGSKLDAAPVPHAGLLNNLKSLLRGNMADEESTA
jgi:hypothetical protein